MNTALGHMPLVRHADELETQVHADDHDRVLAILTPVVLGETRHGFVECRVRRADGSYGWFEVSAVGQLSEQALEGAILTLHDVSERRELTNRLMHQAHHDALTGLPNRALLMQRIDEALVRRDRAFGLLLLDLDDFKVINDRHGHASGDVVLTVIGQRLTGLVRSRGHRRAARRRRVRLPRARQRGRPPGRRGPARRGHRAAGGGGRAALPRAHQHRHRARR